MNRMMIALLLCGTASLGASVAWCNDEDFAASPLSHTFYRPIWCGWMSGDSRRCFKFAKDRKAFSSMIGEFGRGAVEGEDGLLRYDWASFKPESRSGRDGEFFVNLNTRTAFNPKHFYTGRFADDRMEFDAWCKAHPGFCGFVSLEWGNDATMPFRNPKRLVDFGDRSITSNDLARILAKTPKPETRDAFIRTLLKPTYDRIVECCYGRADILHLGEGHYCIEHLAGYWGTGILGIETTREHNGWQIQMMFCRGAARQFRVPWAWYIASYIDGSFEGKFVNACLFAEDSRQFKFHGPDYGISLSSMKRVTYLTYLSGANYYEREAMTHTHFLKEKPPIRLSPEGEMYEGFFDFTQKHDRGAPYVPIAILVPANRGYTRYMGRAFGSMPYTHPDRMLDVVVGTLLDIPTNWRRVDKQRHLERVMCNSRFGDVYDAITPDFEDQTAFKRVIGEYRAAILVGYYGDNPHMEQILRDYVKAGGLLVLNVRQFTKGFGTDFTGIRVAGSFTKGERTFGKLCLNGAKALKCDRFGNTLFSENRYGKGRVIVAAEHYLSPWPGDDDKKVVRALKESVGGDAVRYEDVEWLLSELGRRFVPVSVEGSVQFGLNRTADGWLVYLMNNNGVTKEWNRPQVLDPKDVVVDVDLSRIPHGTVREISAGVTLERSGSRVRLNIPSGDIRILEVLR